MPKPVLQAMVLADHIYRDAGTGKFLIIGTFGTLFVRPNKPESAGAEPASETGESSESEVQGNRRVMSSAEVTDAGSPYLYLALTAIHGEVPLRLRYVDLSDLTVLFEGKFGVVSVDPLALVEVSVPLPRLPTKLGSFSLDVLHDGELLGQWRVSVSVQPRPEGKETDQ